MTKRRPPALDSPPDLPSRTAGREPAPVDRMMPVIYDEMRQLARRALRQRAESLTLQPTGLVHETYLRLLDQRAVDWSDKRHFFRIAAQVMRRVLLDYHRARGTKKRGQGEIRITLVEGLAVENPPEVEFLALDRALDKLEALDPWQAQIVEMRFFAGLTVDETADALGVSRSAVKREWVLIRAWLFLELSGAPLASLEGDAS